MASAATATDMIQIETPDNMVTGQDPQGSAALGPLRGKMLNRRKYPIRPAASSPETGYSQYGHGWRR